jgi:hypothetical protein
MGSAPESPEISRAREGGTLVSEMTGRIISHYKILEKHGGDGMGVVHRTKGTKRRRANALKCLRAELVG